MHLIMGPVTEAVYGALSELQPFDRADYAPRLADLPGDWPPEELGLRCRSVGCVEAGHGTEGLLGLAEHAGVGAAVAAGLMRP